jgi:hypothetical protein
MGWAGIGPAHDQHGYWPSPTTMLIIFVVACRTNYACYNYRNNKKKKKKREESYLG